jgi:hypothetical protein
VVLGFSVFRCVEDSTPRTLGFRILLLYRCEVIQVKDVPWQSIVAVSISQKRQQPEKMFQEEDQFNTASVSPANRHQCGK